MLTLLNTYNFDIFNYISFKVTFLQVHQRFPKQAKNQILTVTE